MLKSTATISVRGTIISRAIRSSKLKTFSTNWYSSRLISPLFKLWLIIRRSSSSDTLSSDSPIVFIPIAFEMPLAVLFSTKISGNITRYQMFNGFAIRNPIFSVRLKATFLGTSSPMMTWMEVKTENETTKDRMVAIASGIGRLPKSVSNRRLKVGSPNQPRAREVIVTPSCVAER